MDSDHKSVDGISDAESGTGPSQGFRSAEKVAESYKWIDRFGLAEKMAKNKHDNKRYSVTEDKLMEYKSRPISQVIACGLLAVVFLSARFWLFLLNDMFGNPFGNNVGWITLCMMFVGAYCAFMAWPKYKYKGVDDEEMDELVKSRNDFRKKFRR